MLASADTMVRDVLGRHLRPVSRIAPDEWADRHRVVLQPSPMPGRWSTARVPYLREPMRAYADAAVRRILLMAATQIGKTEFLANCLMWTIDQDPYPALWVLHSTAEAREFSAQRLIPAIRATRAADRHRSGGAWDTKRQVIKFDTMTLNLMGSNAPGNLASKPVGRLFLDERDKYPTSLRGKGQPEAGAVDLAYKRLDAFGRDGKAVEACSPTVEGFGIAAEFRRSDQRRYHVPCPACGRYQTLRFGLDVSGGGLRWEGGTGRDLADVALAEHETRVRQTAWYECAHCSARIESHHKASMLADGLWLAAGQSIELRPPRKHLKAPPGGAALARDGRPDARGNQVLITGAAPEVDTRGYQLSALYSPFQPFGFVAAEFVKMRGEITQDFVNSRLGEPWRVERGAHGDEAAIIERATAPAKITTATADATPDPWAYTRGTLPSAALVLIASCDVQESSVFWLLAALAPQETLCLIDWGAEPCPEEGGDEAANWAGVAAVLTRSAPFHTRPGGLLVHTAVIDSGFRTHEVYRAALRLGNGWVLPTKGQAGQAAPAAYEILPVQAPAAYVPGAPRGQRSVVASVEMLSIRPDYWKTKAFAALNREPSAHGSVRFPLDAFRDDPGEGIAPGRALVRHFTAEHRVPIRRRGQIAGFAWELRPGRKDNHWWDCLVGAVALAEQLGHGEMTESNADPVNPARSALAAPSSRARPATPLASRGV